MIFAIIHIAQKRTKNSIEIQSAFFSGFLNSFIKEKIALVAIRVKRTNRIVSGTLITPNFKLNSLYNDFEILR
ncbi:MAG: hypothetical protein NRZ51_07265 [Bacillus paranthracis]|nr:MAG: hypothetical protein NRZ51_07265 [Bacillus paranthracis]